MTLIVGIWTSEGVVVASDSAATFASGHMPTIGQQEVTKVRRLGDSIIFANTGAVGMSQMMSEKLRADWENKVFRNVGTPEECMRKIGADISGLLGPFLQSATYVRSLGESVLSSLCKCLIAMPVKHTPQLFTFDFNGAPEHATEELPFVSMGSGQAIADPFLAYLKRLLWKNSHPTIAEARLAAVWTIDHVCRTNPGGVSGPTQLAVLARTAGQQPIVTMVTPSAIDEHMQQVVAAEKSLVDEIRGRGAGTAAVPQERPPIVESSEGSG